jgi:hypothetical protein
LLGATPHDRVSGAGFHRDPRHVDQKARVDAVVAGRDALAAIGADLGPARGFGDAWPAGNEVHEAGGDDRRALALAAGVDPGRLDHRARGNAFAAAGAGVEAGLDPSAQGIEKADAGGVLHDGGLRVDNPGIT